MTLSNEHIERLIGLTELAMDSQREAFVAVQTMLALLDRTVTLLETVIIPPSPDEPLAAFDCEVYDGVLLNDEGEVEAA